MTLQQIIDLVKKTTIAKATKYDSLDKLKKSVYFVEGVKDEIGRLAFFYGDFEYTVEDEKKALKEIFGTGEKK